MTRGSLVACAVVLALAAPGLAAAGEVRLSITNGRVDLVARDATLREILIEWERVGGTRIVNRDRVPGTRLSLELANVSEDQALSTLLRPMAGYLASRRLGSEGGASAFSRIILMPALATPVTYIAAAPAPAPPPSNAGGQSGPPAGRPGMQRRILPDGRVVTVMDEAQADDASEAAPSNAPGLMRPPFGAPPRQQGQDAADAPQADVQPGQVAPTAATAPMVPMTVGKPGVLPVTKPGAAPAAPIKPPGD
jgi:hypothetical protein